MENEIERLCQAGSISTEQAQALDRQKLTALFNSAFAARMFQSERLYREIKVSSFVPVNELEETQETDKVLVQGIADCVLEENGALVLVDYKTDKFKSIDEIKNKYAKQLNLYSKALEKCTNVNVKQNVLYLFYTGDQILM